MEVKHFGIIFLLILTMIIPAGCSGGPVIDPQSGVMIRQGTPEAALSTYYELLSAGSFEAAHGLYTEQSREDIPVDMLERILRVNNLQGSRLGKIWPARIAGNLAVVSHVQLNRFPGMPGESPMLGIAIFHKEGKNWAMVRGIDELAHSEMTIIAEMLVAEGDLLEESIATLNGLQEEQKGSLIGQLMLMKANHIAFAQELENLKNLDTKEQLRELQRILGRPDPEEELPDMDFGMDSDLDMYDLDNPMKMPLDHLPAGQQEDN